MIYIPQLIIIFQVLQQTLPADVFTLLIQKMRFLGSKAASKSSQQDAVLSDLNDELE